MSTEKKIIKNYRISNVSRHFYNLKLNKFSQVDLIEESISYQHVIFVIRRSQI